jgi:hypothetical protein
MQQDPTSAFLASGNFSVPISGGSSSGLMSSASADTSGSHLSPNLSSYSTSIPVSCQLFVPPTSPAPAPSPCHLPVLKLHHQPMIHSKANQVNGHLIKMKLRRNSVITITVIANSRLKQTKMVTYFWTKLWVKCINLNGCNNVTVKTNNYWQSCRVRYDRVWLCIWICWI